MNQQKILQRPEKVLKDSEKESDVLPIQEQYELPFEIGKEYFVRTVTYHLTGRLINIVGKFLVFEDAAWIADSGRFHEFFTDTPSASLEVEPFGKRNVFVNTDAIVDATERGVLLEVK